MTILKLCNRFWGVFGYLYSDSSNIYKNNFLNLAYINCTKK
jgi:hypothetical protein